MLFGLFRGDATILILIPAMIFAIWAQINVNSTFKKYSQVKNMRGLTGAAAARRILDANGLQHVTIEHIGGELTDHYDPRANVIRLSDSVYASTSAAAVGVAAHEAGHAIQHSVGYAPIKLRTAIIPMTRIGSMLSMPLFLIGLLFGGSAYLAGGLGDILMLTGIVLFSFSTLFQLVTLPTEFNASSRALAVLRDGGILYDAEIDAASKVLRAAALTYVAALASSLASLLRLILLFSGSRRR